MPRQEHEIITVDNWYEIEELDNSVYAIGLQEYFQYFQFRYISM